MLENIPTSKVQKAVTLFLEGKTKLEVHQITGLSFDSLANVVKSLNDSNSYYYDPVSYEKIQTIRLKKRKKIHESVIQQEHIPSVFKNKSSILLNEIALLALTYRVSLKTLAVLFETSIDDIKETFLNHSIFRESLYSLHLETQNETKEEEKIAYEKARMYLYLRQKLILAIKKENRQEIKEGYRALHVNLMKEVDDTFIKEIIGKGFLSLTEEEREAIARFRLKYYFSYLECAKKVQSTPDSIKKCEEELALKDKIYAKKLEVLNENYYLKSEEAKRRL